MSASCYNRLRARRSMLECRAYEAVGKRILFCEVVVLALAPLAFA